MSKTFFFLTSEMVLFIFVGLLDIAIIAGNQSKKYFKDVENKSSLNVN
tara:strand:+ start:294 stop:437 length:144 start_codon:yes stop_codon:yes gene_type:complete